MNLQINGYTINPRIHSLNELMSLMSKYGVVAHTKAQAKSILHLMRVVGVKHLSHFTSSEVLELNAPCKAEANRIYSLEVRQGLPVVAVWNYASQPSSALEVDEVISGKTWINWIQDLM